MRGSAPRPVRLTERGHTAAAWLATVVLLAAMILPSAWQGVAW